MKKIGKLSINPEKLIKEKELVNLKGGYDDDCCECRYGANVWVIYGHDNETDCASDCQGQGGWHDWVC